MSSDVPPTGSPPARGDPTPSGGRPLAERPAPLNVTPDTLVRTLRAHAGLPAPRTDAVPGYKLLGELGRGGMGVVYKARHLKLNRLVALKMILAGAHPGTQERNRFMVEAEAVARLQHPNIV